MKRAREAGQTIPFIKQDMCKLTLPSRTAFLFILCVFLFIFTSASVYALLALGAYYIFLGFAMTRFIQASYTNAVFDKYINAHIEGAKVNRGLAQDDDDEDEEEEDENGVNPPSSEQQ